MIDFLSGAVTLTYVVAALYFFNFWKRAADRLFLAFAIAFALLAANQVVLFALGTADERGNYAYILRVLAFILILVAIIEKNVSRRARRRQ
jgi:hypothetical protein